MLRKLILLTRIVRTMAIYRACKTLLTGVAIASTCLLSVSCSHEMHADGQAAASEEMTGAMDGDSMGHEHGDSEHTGVNTNHDIYHSRALEVPAGTPVPGLTIDVEEDAVRGWNLYVGTANFTFEPEKVNGESLPTEGHAHLYINDKSMQRIYGTWTHLPELPVGTNEIRVTLNANGHETLTTQGQPIEETVTVEVYDPNAADN